MQYIQWFFKAVLAGMMISIGCIVYLQTTVQCGDAFKWVGAILFSVGLYAVVTYQLNLYTGKVGYILENDREYVIEVLVTIVGNFIGCMIMGFAFPLDYAVVVCDSKLALNYFTLLMNAVMCGVLMYLAVDIYKTKNTPLGVFIAVPVFIMAGFDHSIADMFYLFSGGCMFTFESLVFIVIVLFGNLIGCCLFPAYRLCFEQSRDSN